MDASVSKRPIELASEAPFTIGNLEVRPATLEVVTPSGREQLEPRIMQVLVALARKRGEVVSRDELIQVCWGGRVVGEDSINRCISRLHKLARAHGAFALETVPRVGVRLVEAVGATPVRRPGRRKAIVAAVAVLAALVAAGLAVWIWRDAASLDREPRIALTAFEALESDPQSRAFAKRLTDDVAGVLNENVAGLAPPGPEGSLDKADLRVGGSARREGATLRVRAYLEDGRDRVTLWSRQYERPAAEEEVLRTQVAVDLSDNLLDALEPLQQKGLKVDSRTLALWLSATARHRQGTVRGDPRIAAQAFEQVVERAPDFARARGMMAQSLALASPGVAPAEAAALRRRARAEAEKSIRTDPMTADAGYDTLYWLTRMERPTDLAAAEDVWIAGLARSPNLHAGLMRRCELLLDVGRAGEALPSCERAAALRPLGAPWGYRYARALAATGQAERAEQAIAREVRLHPEHVRIRQVRFEMEVLSGPPAKALAVLHDPASPPAFTQAQIDAFDALLKARASGAPGDVARAVTKLRAAAQSGGIGRTQLFQALVVLGRLDDAFALTEPRPGSPDMNPNGGWLFAPGMSAAHRDPRFWPLAARMGLIRYWRTRGAWPDFCHEPGLPFDCATAAARASPL